MGSAWPQLPTCNPKIYHIIYGGLYHTWWFELPLLDVDKLRLFQSRRKCPNSQFSLIDPLKGHCYSLTSVIDKSFLVASTVLRCECFVKCFKHSPQN